MIKRNLSILLVLMLIMSIVLTGCSGSETTEVKETPKTPEAPKPAEVSKSGLTEPIKLVFAHAQQATSEPGKAIQAYADAVGETSDGMISVEVFAGAQLGGERDTLEGLSMGTVDMAYISSGVCENFVPLFGVMNLPFVFQGYDHLEAVLHSEVKDILAEKMLIEKNIKVLTILNQGIRYTYSNKPVEKIADVVGMKIRVPEAPMAMGIWSELGSNPTPVPWTEVYTAMSTKIVEGFEVHVYAVLMEKLEETFTYAALTGHQVSSSPVMISENVWKDLPKEAQNILLDCIDILEKENYKNIVEAEPQQLTYLEDHGIKVYEFSLEQKEEMKTKCLSLYDDWIKKTEGGAEIVEIVESLAK